MTKSTPDTLKTVNIHEAKTQLSRLVADAAKGEPFIIAKAGTPLVKVTPIASPTVPKRIGFLAGEFTVPDDFDTMADDHIEALFHGDL